MRKVWRKATLLRRILAPRVLESSSIPPDELARVARTGCRISVIVPVHDTPPELLNECIRSVVGQAYPNWELCVCDDASTREETRRVLELYRGSDPRLRIVRSDVSLHIARASNLAAEQASGKFVAFLDHDDRLHPAALFEIAKADLEFDDIDLMYTDEDKLDQAGERCDTYFKPDWSPEHLDSVMYVLHLLVVRKSLFWALGGLRHEVTGAQDYDLALRASARARRIHHIDKVLYHWRMTTGSAAAVVEAKPYALLAAKRALSDSISERGLVATVEEGLLPGTFRVRRSVRGEPPVTLLILTDHRKRDISQRGEIDLLGNFVRSVLDKSTYRNRRIVVVDNSNAPDATRRWLENHGAKLVSYASSAPFNYPRKLNFALRSVDTEHVILLNDDLEVITPDWIESLLEFSQEPGIGVAGAQLLYPDGRIQHAGIVLGVNDSAAHVFHGMLRMRVGYNGYSHVIRNYS
ncbi:MAG: glycosyltransferase family 2 protein, partial [Candidatus Binatia bacterium]